MTISGSGGTHLVTILSEMVRSALVWEEKNSVYRSTGKHRNRDGLDCIHGVNTLSVHNGTTQPQELEEVEDHDISIQQARTPPHDLRGSERSPR